MQKHILLFSFLIAAILLLRFAFDDSGKKKYVDVVLPTSYSFIKLNDDYQLVKDTLAFDFQYPQIEKFLCTPVKQHTIEGELNRKDSSFLKYYGHYLHSQDPKAKDIGNLSYGMYYSCNGEGELALDFLNKLVSLDGQLIRYWKARSLALKGAFSEASIMLESCLKDNLYPDSCLKYLLVGSLKANDFDSAYKLIQKYPETRVFLTEGEYLKILKSNVSSLEFLVKKLKSDISKFPFYASFFVALIWFCLLVNLNIFDAKLLPAALTVGSLSLLSTLFLADYLYDTYGEGLLNASRSSLFFYSVMVIGVVEEFVKAVPFILVLLIFKPKDSVVLLIVAGVSGLVFSFLENIMYLDKYGYNAVAARGFNPTIIHIVLTSFFAYAVNYSRYKGSKLMGAWLLLAFVLSAFLHGIYDYFIFLERDFQVNEVSALSRIMVVLLVVVYGMFLANSLNMSIKFSYPKTLRLKDKVYLFLLCFFAIELFEYANVLYHTGVESADLWLFVNFVKVIFIAYLYSYIITYKDLIKGRWSIFNACPFYSKTDLNKLFFSSGKIVAGKEEFELIPIQRLSDREYNSGYFKLQEIKYFGLNGKEPILKMEKIGAKTYSFGQNAKLGYFNQERDFVKVKDVKVKLDESNSSQKKLAKEGS